MMRHTFSALIALLAALAIGAQTAADPADGTVWYVIRSEAGAQLGQASREIVSGPDGRDVIASQSLYLADEGGSPTVVTARTVYRQDATGAVRAIESESRSGRARTFTTARIDGDGTLVERETAAGRSASRVALPPGVRFDEGQALLRSWDPAATPSLAFDNFNIDAMSVERIVIEPIPDATQEAEGRFVALRRRYQHDQLIGVARLLIDAEGRVVRTLQPMFATTIHIVETDRETAQRFHPPYRVMPNLMTQSPFRISNAAAQSHIRYRFAFRDGIEFALPQTGEQRATPGHGGVTLDICADCGPGLAADEGALAEALRPTAWMQSDHPRLRAIAQPVARLDVSDVRKMNMLLERARPYLERIDFRGHYTALDTLSRRAGDCTEAAVLLAALGRAAGIPTRVASGLVYSRARYHGVSNVFMPHSWTLAWVDGEWRSFDLALDHFDSTHIALTVGDGDARSIAAAAQLASLLRWEGVAEVRARTGD